MGDPVTKLLGALLLWLSLAGGALAQGAHAPDADIQQNLLQATSALRGAGAGFRTDPLSDQEIKSRLVAIGAVEARLENILADLTPRLQDSEARLNQLGATPARGRREDPHAPLIRRQLTSAVAIFQSDEREARLELAESRQIGDVLAERLRENFESRLTSQNRTLTDPQLWEGLAASADGDLSRLADFASDEADAFGDALGEPRSILIGAVAGALALGLLGPARLFLMSLAQRRARRDASGSRLTRALLALFRVLVGVVTPWLALLAVRTALMDAHALSESGETIAVLFERAAVFGLFIEALGRALISPGRSQWRLTPIRDEVARRLSVFPALIGLTAGLATFVAGFDAALGASQSAQVVSDYAALVLEIAAVAGFLVALGRARLANANPGDEPQAAGLPWVVAALAGWLAVFVSLGAALIGYLAFAGFLMRETIWIGAILGLLLLLLQIASDAVPALVAPKARFGAALETGLGLSARAVEQIGVLASGLASVVLILLAWMAIIAPFGASAGDIFGRLTSTSFVLRLGKAEISPGAVLGAAALFFLGLAATRAVRRWLEARYLPKTQLDVGLRTSLAAGVTYLGGLIAILAAFAYLGLTFSQIALFASALSVGIGFGLQSIIGNFVSGLILLAERPVRVGDWVAIGDLEGDVRKIAIRATEIEMQDRSRLIVPNTLLVTQTVRNVTHDGALGRVKIVLKVADSADVAAVRALIVKHLTGHKDVLKTPAPAAYISDVRDGAIEFTAFAYVKSPRIAFRVKSELYFELLPDLKTAGIALSSTTTIVNVDMAERPLEPDATKAQP
jgi:small-conductance mechanosensitive channel